MSLIPALNWRYATKQFDLDRELSPEKLQTLTEAVRLTASSLGLQPYRLFVVTDPGLRAALVDHSYGQVKVAESSALFVFAVDTNITDETIDRYLDLIAAERHCSRESLAEFEAMCKSFLGWKSTTERTEWAMRQAYIALGNLLTVAAEMEIDACPMEGFDAAGYDTVLGLDKLGLTTAVIATVGYRSQEDADAQLPKVRTPVAEFASYL